MICGSHRATQGPTEVAVCVQEHVVSWPSLQHQPTLCVNQTAGVGFAHIGSESAPPPRTATLICSPTWFWSDVSRHGTPTPANDRPELPKIFVRDTGLLHTAGKALRNPRPPQANGTATVPFRGGVPTTSASDCRGRSPCCRSAERTTCAHALPGQGNPRDAHSTCHKASLYRGASRVDDNHPVSMNGGPRYHHNL